ncbi:transketolase [Oligella urethralis]|uniref:transketolase n=1 Tax=Oligella urethralis TaxID=90245 RepID=UPI000E0753B0|nr:transketolase [Oligella urethralis]SUA59426.1 Transketolase 1 [Oligella urethralis]
MNSSSGIQPTDLANAIRALSMDAVQQANSGHPGAPMGMAEIAVALWTRHLNHNPNNPLWPNRDRFVLSNGHGSMLLYSLLHLSGYDLPIEEIKNFRQLHSKTPGHPENFVTAGVETTTGPLGQGLANSVGFALAEQLLAKEFNRPGHEIVDHNTYVFVGDGCLMEGISHEACSLAGTLKLNKLIVLYDDNGISIDGEVQPWFSDDTAKRFESYGWQVIPQVDGHDVEAVSAAIEQAKTWAAEADRGPTLICCRTVIGQGSPKLAGTAKVHGAPLGADEIQATRQAIGWDAEPFEIPEAIKSAWDLREQGTQKEALWADKFAAYSAAHPELAREFERRVQGDLPADFAVRFQAFLDETVQRAETVATRKASQFVIEALQAMLPELIGGSADLTGSNFTDWSGAVAVRAGQDTPAGRHINYGVREFAMAAMMNGMALHGGYLPFGGTFLTFSDYSRNAIRMAALMKQRVIHIFTHDSIGLGEDGPTHQSIEHASSLRLIPNLDVWRPCDTVETAVAWRSAVERPVTVGAQVKDGGPSALLLSRQNLPFMPRTETALAQIAMGAYVLSDADNAQAVIVATGSEVEIAIKAQQQLAAEGIAVRVVSMPSTNVFDRQSKAYREAVLPPALPTVAVEAGSTDLWYKYVGRDGAVVGIDSYGASAPAGELFNYFGLTAEKVVAAVKNLL